MVNPALVEETLDRITASDLELIWQLCLPHKIICQKMGISHTALRARIRRLMQKMGVENQRALIVKALHLQLISIENLTYRSFNGEANLS